MKLLGALLLLLLLLLSLGCSANVEVCPQAPPPLTCTRGRTFVLVRHAEKAIIPEGSNDKDPSLSDRGKARAEVIAAMFANAGVTRLVATQYKRTQETLAALGQRLSIPVDVRPADKTKDLITELQASPDGAVVVIATHSNVLPLMATELSHGKKLRGVTGDAIPDDDYARVVVIAEPCSGTPLLLELSSFVVATESH